MRIVFIAGEYPPLEGGLGAFTRELARACAGLGHSVAVITRRAPGAPEVETAGGVAVHRLAGGWNWSTLRSVDRFCREHRPDVVDIQYQAAAYQMHPAINWLPRAVRRRTPCAVTFHDLRAPYLFPKAGPLRRQAILVMARGANAAIVTNVEDEDALSGAGVTRVYRVPIGSNIAPAALPGFDLAAWRRARGIPDGALLAGYFGFLNESKGGETLLRALAELQGHAAGAAVLLIGGQTGASDPTNQAYAQRLMQLAAQLGIADRVYATGFVADAGVSEAFAACDCVALPYRDGASFRRGTLMAALAHGSAIITTTPRAALPELVHGHNVFLVPPDDPRALAGAITRVGADRDLRARLQRGSRELSRSFQWEAIAAETMRVFDRAIGARSRGEKP